MPCLRAMRLGLPGAGDYVEDYCVKRQQVGELPNQNNPPEPLLALRQQIDVRPLN